MTLEQFNKHKQSIKEALELNLLRDTIHLNNGLQTYRKDSVKEVSQTIKILNKDDIVSKIKELDKLINTARLVKGTTVIQIPITVMNHCTTNFKGTKFIVTWKELRTEIDDRQVEQHMKRYVSKMLTPKDKRNTEYYWNLTTVDCKIMELFKKGKITWEDCVESHKVQCKF